jgi:flavin reductase (DIM6/NTAB) family NADH-FMN oxidoreductase RutF
MAADPLFAALGRIPSGLFILTAGTGGASAGMLASWVQQCSFDPPQLTVAVNPGRAIAGLLRAGEPFAVCQLAAGQNHLLAHFGRGPEPGESAFRGIAIDTLPCGVAVLAEAVGYLECRVEKRLSAGDHDLVIGRIVDGRLQSESPPSVHIRKNGSHY